MFKNSFKNKKVMVTGATGFKGSWLCIWLLKLGAHVTGYSKDIPTSPSLFVSAGLNNKIDHIVGDVCDTEYFESVLQNVKPDYLFHMAAQPIVSVSYEIPLDTFQTNTLGTVSVLDVLRRVTWRCAAVFITSDKCYENVEWLWGYREIDSLGGKDIYSASKAAAEIAISSYHRSFFSLSDHSVRLASVRAGNVIGGGDWATDRIVVDCIKSWTNGEPVQIRSPNATRPWQHVLEPLSGYLLLASTIYKTKALSGEAFNFGPKGDANKSVLQLINDLSQYWSNNDMNEKARIQNAISFNEAKLLQLNCDKALNLLDWTATLSYKKCVELVGQWYNSVCLENENPLDQCVDQIAQYEEIAVMTNQAWALPK